VQVRVAPGLRPDVHRGVVAAVEGVVLHARILPRVHSHACPDGIVKLLLGEVRTRPMVVVEAAFLSARLGGYREALAGEALLA
jgi:hypothetical protein